MNGGFKDVILDEVYDELVDRYQYACPSGANKQQSKAAAKPAAPKPPAPPKPPTPPKSPSAAKPKPKQETCPNKPQTAQTFGEQCGPGMYFCTDAQKCKPIPKGKTLTDSGWLVDMSEFDYKTCARGDGTTYGISNKSSCKKGDEVKSKVVKDTGDDALQASIDAIKSLLKGDLKATQKSLEKSIKARAKLQKLEPQAPPVKSAGKSLVRAGLKAVGSSASFAEALDFGQLCERQDGTTYGTAGVCRKGTPTSRDDVMKKIEAAGPISAESKARLEKASDEQLGRIATAVSKGSTAEEGEKVSSAVEKLKEKSGGKKEGGANLQDPAEAKKYAEFYEKKQDLTYKAPLDTKPSVVKETLRQLKEEDPEAYKSTISALNGKGSPTKEQLAEAGWKGSSERGEAVLKSLMDNDFKDVNGTESSWRQGLQLDHRQAGSTGGKDEPSNWIWISTASNQVKGGMEAAAKRKGGSAAEKEEFIRQGLITKLNKNAEMSKQDVAAAKGAGSAKALAKAQQATALRDNLPLMTSAQRGERINNAGGEEMKSMLKASVATGKNPETNRATSYRPVLSGGAGARVRKDYGTVPQMKSVARMRWDQKLSDSDLRNIGGVLKSSTGSTKSRSDLLNEMLGNFPRTSGLTAAERIAILDAAE